MEEPSSGQIIRAKLDEAERLISWIAWPDRQIYGPGMTSCEVGQAHAAMLRGPFSQASSGAYRNVRCAPDTDPGPFWQEHYPTWRIGVDPWSKR